VFAATASLFLASCSTSPDGQTASFALTNPAETATLPAAADGETISSPALPGETVGSEGDAGPSTLPEKVAYLPAAKPDAAFPEAGIAATAGTDPSPVAEPEAEPAAAPKPLSNAAARAGLLPAAKSTAPKTQEPAPTKEQVLTNGPDPVAEQVMTATESPLQQVPAKKRGLFASLFSANQAAAAPAPPQSPKLAAPEPEAQPLVKLASIEPTEQVAVSRASTGSYGSDALPGVRQTMLFEIKRKSGLDDDSDVDIHEEDDYAPVQVASAAGMARLAPNGLLRQTNNVDVGCLKPSLVRTLKQLERHFGRKVMVTSGYRSPAHNRRARGAKNSQHMYCAAADIQIAGVSKWDLASYARSMPGRGGVGTYCHTNSVHVDVGPERDWNWRCRRRKA
jgi:uncharacterized protein YcbK (DUF882 family)